MVKVIAPKRGIRFFSQSLRIARECGGDVTLYVGQPLVKKLRQRCLGRFQIRAAVYFRDQAGTLDLGLTLCPSEAVPLAPTFAGGRITDFKDNGESTRRALSDVAFHFVSPSLPGVSSSFGIQPSRDRPSGPNSAAFRLTICSAMYASASGVASDCKAPCSLSHRRVVGAGKAAGAGRVRQTVQ